MSPTGHGKILRMELIYVEKKSKQKIDFRVRAISLQICKNIEIYFP